MDAVIWSRFSCSSCLCCNSLSLPNEQAPNPQLQQHIQESVILWVGIIVENGGTRQRTEASSPGNCAAGRTVPRPVELRHLHGTLVADDRRTMHAQRLWPPGRDRSTGACLTPMPQILLQSNNRKRLVISSAAQRLGIVNSQYFNRGTVKCATL